MVSSSGDLFTAPVPPASPFEGKATGRRPSQQRHLTNQEAVERRRAIRKAKTAAKRQEVAIRMARRFFPGQINLLLLDIRYWQLRKCGWDVQSRELRTTGRDRQTGQPLLVEPRETAHWLWWAGLHPKRRALILELSDTRLVRS